MVVGYARVSTIEQNLSRQHDALRTYGVDMIFSEKMSGTKKNRPELDAMLSKLNPGDTVVIESLSRLGRSVKNLCDLMEYFENNNIRVVSLKETIDTTSPTGKLLFSVLASLSQFERDVLAQRTQEGLAAARARGRVGGRPKADQAALQKAIALYNTKQYSVSEVTGLTGISKSVLYRALKGM